MDYLAYPIRVSISPLEDREFEELAMEHADNQVFLLYIADARRALTATYTDDALNREIEKWSNCACMHDDTPIGHLAGIVYDGLSGWRDAVQSALREEVAKRNATTVFSQGGQP